MYDWRIHPIQFCWCPGHAQLLGILRRVRGEAANWLALNEFNLSCHNRDI